MNDSHTSVTKSQLPGVWNAGRDCPELISIHFKGQEFLIRSRERRGGAEVVVRRPSEVVTHSHKSKQTAYREKGRQAAPAV